MTEVVNVSLSPLRTETVICVSTDHFCQNSYEGLLTLPNVNALYKGVNGCISVANHEGLLTLPDVNVLLYGTNGVFGVMNHEGLLTPIKS